MLSKHATIPETERMLPCLHAVEKDATLFRNAFKMALNMKEEGRVSSTHDFGQTALKFGAIPSAPP